MQNRQKRIYIETSAVNALREKFTWADAVATKAHLNVKGKGWYISPIVLWEIMATKNEEDRESLIFFAQHLFEETLLPSPEELIVSYITKGCPEVEPEHHLASDGNFSNVWRSICEIKEKTLVFSQKEHDRLTKIIRNYGIKINQFYSHGSLDIRANEEISSLQANVLHQMRRFSVVDKNLLSDPETSRILGLAGFLVIIVLCGGAGLDGKTVRDYWSKLGISKSEDRIAYAFSELKPLFIRGPLFAMATMCAVQSGSKSNRGMIFDCMHSVYAIYSDLFISADNHFRELREHVQDNNDLRLRICMLDEVTFTSTPRIVPPPGSIIWGG